MALTESTMLPLGTEAPDFCLTDTISGKEICLEDVRGPKGTVIFFICNHCPYVKHVNRELVRLAGDYMDEGIGFVAISSNDIIKYPDDAPDKMKEVAAKEGYPFPYLFDESQDVARAYDAACTPDNYLFDENICLVYRGQLDGSRPQSDIPVTGKDIRRALDALLAGTDFPEPQIPSAGCNIKWKPS